MLAENRMQVKDSKFERSERNEHHFDAPAGDQPQAQDPGLARAMERSAAAHAYVRDELDRDNQFQIVGSESKIVHAAETTLKVGAELGRGALAEAINHPGALARDFAVGAATGTALVLLPELSIPGMLWTGYQAYKHRDQIAGAAREFSHDLAVMNDSEKYSPAQTEAARLSLQNFGALGAETAAGIAGAAAGGYATNLLRNAFNAEPSVLPTGTDSSGPVALKPAARNGDNFDATVERAVKQANTMQRPVEVELNNHVTVTDHPNQTVPEFIREHTAKREAIVDAYMKSPEYAAETAARIKDQATINQLVAELPSALKAGDTAVVDWIGKFAAINDNFTLKFSKKLIADAFEASGYRRNAYVGDPAVDTNAHAFAGWLAGQSVNDLRSGMPINQIAEKFAADFRTLFVK
jgi:hypothetical protein